MNKKTFYLILVGILILGLTGLLIFFFVSSQKKDALKESGMSKVFNLRSGYNQEEFKKFASRQEVLDYLEKAQKETEAVMEGLSFRGSQLSDSFQMSAPAPDVGRLGEEGFSGSFFKSGDSQMSAPAYEAVGLQEAGRVSETNVQVLGIDEPDIVKTDGKNIYFSSRESWIAPYEIATDRLLDDDESAFSPGVKPRSVLPPNYEKPQTKIISAFPVSNLAKINSLQKTGNLLLVKDEKILVILGDQEITAYEVSDPKNPREKWVYKLEENTRLIESRLHKDRIYLIASNYLNRDDPCPIKPLKSGAEDITIDCGEIYHSSRFIPTDSLFSVFALEAKSGQVKEKTSFLGSDSNFNLYMSEKAIYATYVFFNNPYDFIVEAFSQSARDILPASLIERLEKVKGYDISNEAKLRELEEVLYDYHRTLSRDDEMRIENEMKNRLSDYFKEHSRDLKKTGIAKINLSDFKVSASGTVPGELLNQFSLDEYEDNLRVATSVGEGFWMIDNLAESRANDVYVLNSKLEIIGSLKNLGITERIYSARFLGERGYLVTFRQIDPFYVLDLSDPKNPQMKGELKIPGYSSYLHPLADNIILGVGREEGKIKLSLFDVSNPADPREMDKYFLSEYWSEAESNHRAFLQDAKHEIFFLPGGKGGYIFSYEGKKLSLKKTISDYQVKRAVYIEDYLYIIGEKKISVLDEKNWEKVKELDI